MQTAKMQRGSQQQTANAKGGGFGGGMQTTEIVRQADQTDGADQPPAPRQR